MDYILLRIFNIKGANNDEYRPTTSLFNEALTDLINKSITLMEDLCNELAGWAREIVWMWCARADWIVAVGVGKRKDLGIRKQKAERVKKEMLYCKNKHTLNQTCNKINLYLASSYDALHSVKQRYNGTEPEVQSASPFLQELKNTAIVAGVAELIYCFDGMGIQTKEIENTAIPPSINVTLEKDEMVDVFMGCAINDGEIFIKLRFKILKCFLCNFPS